MFIWEAVDKKDVLVVSEYNKEEYCFIVEFTLYELFVRETVKKSENEVKLLTNVLPWTPVELRQHLETKVF